MSKGTLIHGIGASSHIDSSGERLSIEGMDISSLESGTGVFNYEHKNDNASHVVGKVLKAKKIFSEKDCEDEHQLKFWNKFKMPYLYIMGELFDGAGHEQAKEVAAIVRYDAESQAGGSKAPNIISFSVEGAKIAKEGCDIVKSIARKISITSTPCNKAAIAEQLQPNDLSQNPKDKSNSLLGSIFKTEDSGVEILVKAQLPGSKYPSGFPKMTAEPGKGMTGSAVSPKINAPKPVESTPLIPSKEPVDPGKKIGQTRSGKDVFSHLGSGGYKGFSSRDHHEAGSLHYDAAQASKDPIAAKHHTKMMQFHFAARDRAERLDEAKKRQQTIVATQQAKLGLPGFKKSLTAGGSVLAPEDLESKKKRVKIKREAAKSWPQYKLIKRFVEEKYPNLTKSGIEFVATTIAYRQMLKAEANLESMAKKWEDQDEFGTHLKPGPKQFSLRKLNRDREWIHSITQKGGKVKHQGRAATVVEETKDPIGNDDITIQFDDDGSHKKLHASEVDSSNYQESPRRKKKDLKKRKAVLHSSENIEKLNDNSCDEFGYSSQEKPEKLNKSEDFEALKKSKKDIMPMFGQAPEAHHHEFANWASKSLPNKDWQIWAARNYKKSPESFTPEVKQQIEHFGGSTHIPEISKVRFDKTHDLNAGLGIFKEAEDSYNKRIGQNLNVVKPDSGTKKVLDVGNKMAWFSLARGGCPDEGKAMGHCGNMPSKKPGDRILSLRTVHKNSKGEEFHEPHATFIVNEGYLGEMKGRGNTKPHEKYHEAIAKLLMHPKIKGVVGGGYLHHQNFNIQDLSPEYKAKVLEQKPNIDVYGSDEAPEDLPEKFKDEVEPILKFKKEAKAKYGDDWRKGMLEDISTENAPTMALNAIDNPTDDELHKIIANENTPRDSKVQAAMIGKNSARLHKVLATSSPGDIGYLNNPNIDAILDTGNETAIASLSANRSLKSKDLDRIVNHPNFNNFDETAHLELLNHEELDKKHINKFINSPHNSVKKGIIRNSPELAENFIDDLDPEIRSYAARHGKLSLNTQKRILTQKQILSPEKISDELAQNPHLHPEVAQTLAEHSINRKVDDDFTPQNIQESLLQNDDLSPKTIETIAKKPMDEAVIRGIYRHKNTPQNVFNAFAKEQSKNENSFDKFHSYILRSPRLTEKQFDHLNKKFGKMEKWKNSFVEHKFYKPKEDEIHPNANKKLLQNHFDRLKEIGSEQHSAAQDKLIEQAIGAGSLREVNNAISSGVLDNEHHAKLHDELDAIDTGDHELSPRQSWDKRKYIELLHNQVSDPDLPSGYHDEVLKRLEDNGEDVSDIVNMYFDNNSDDYSDQISDRAREIDEENYPFSSYLDDIKSNRGHPLDSHLNIGGGYGKNRNMSKFKEHIDELTNQELVNAGKIDQEGNYQDSDYKDAHQNAKDKLYEGLRSYLDGDSSALPNHLHDEADSHGDKLNESYYDSVSDGSGSGWDEARRELKRELRTDPTMWPDHLKDTKWAKENIKPKKNEYSESNIDDGHGVFGDEKEEDKLVASEEMKKSRELDKNIGHLKFKNFPKVNTRPDSQIDPVGEKGTPKKLKAKLFENRVRQNLTSAGADKRYASDAGIINRRSVDRQNEMLGQNVGGYTVSHGVRDKIGQPMGVVSGNLPDDKIGSKRYNKVVQHEGVHFSLQDLANKYGLDHGQIEKVQQHLMSHVHEHDLKPILRMMSENGYKNPELDTEEQLAQVSDFVRNYGQETLQNFAQGDEKPNIGRLKQSWKNIRIAAENLKPDFFSQKEEKLAASEKMMKTDYYGKGLPMGWISPEGKFFEIGKDDKHYEAIGEHTGVHPEHEDDYDRPQIHAFENGWLAVGHAGELNFQGHRNVISNPNHPAMKAMKNLARQTMKTHPEEDYIEIHSYDDGGGKMDSIPLKHFSKFGTLKKAEDDWGIVDKPEDSDPRLTVRGLKIDPNTNLKFGTKSHFDPENGTLHTPKGSFAVMIPSGKTYSQILQSPDIQKIHTKATNNWMALNKILNSGKTLPDNIIANAAVFSILSANRPVPSQELSYSRLKDTQRKLKMDFRTPEFAEQMSPSGEGRKEWIRQDSPIELPRHSREYWEGQAKPAITQGAFSPETKRKPGDIISPGMFDAFSDRLAKYPETHKYITDLVRKYGPDSRSIVSEMMADKSNHKLPEDHPMKIGVGLGSKTSRYMANMLGGGNTVIPDTHFVRHIFGLDSNTDASTLDYLKKILWEPKNHHILNSLDEFYLKNHPSAKFVQDRYFGGKEDPNSIFPAFWLHWLTVAPHEKVQGIGNPSQASNLTDHTPFWNTAKKILDKHGLGEGIEKSEKDPIHIRTAKAMHEMEMKLGTVPASMVYYAYLLPKLFEGSEKPFSKSEKDSTIELDHKDILASTKSVRAAKRSNESGKGSKTDGPLHVWKLEDGRHLLVDGHHRFADGISKGKKKFKVQVVGSGYTDYWSTPQKDDEFDPEKSLKKSFDEKEIQTKIQNKEDPTYSTLVNHEFHLNSNPAPDHFKKASEDPEIKLKHIPSSKKQFGGISPKIITMAPTTLDDKGNLAGKENYVMIKPYHRPMNLSLSKYLTHPIAGWSTITAKNLFNAAGIGAEQVSTHTINGTPVTVHHFEEEAKPLVAVENHENYTVDPAKAHKIVVMDFLMNNLDRHTGNLLVKKHSDATGYNDIVPIDHELGFQYRRAKKFHGNWARHEDQWKYAKEHLDDYQDASAITKLRTGLAFQMGHDAMSQPWVQDSTSEWWQTNRDNIVKTLEENLKGLKDEKVIDHIRTHFMDRVRYMDDWSKIIKEQDPDDPNPVDPKKLINPSRVTLSRKWKLPKMTTDQMNAPTEPINENNK